MDLPGPTAQPTPFQHPAAADASPRPSRRPILWVLTLGLLAACILFQHKGESDPAREQKAFAGQEITPPDDPLLVLLGKLTLGIKGMLPPQVMQQYMSGIQSAADGSVGWKPEKEPDSFMVQPDLTRVVSYKNTKPSAAERVRVAILAAESLGPEAMTNRLDDIEKQLAPDSVLHADVDLLRSIYGESHAADETSPPFDQVKEFRKRHGWCARLALSHGDEDDPFRTKARDDASAIILILVLFGVLVSGALIVGVLLLLLGVILVIVYGGQGKVFSGFKRFSPEPDAQFSHAWLETVAVFLGMFLALQLIHTAADKWAAKNAAWTIWISLGGQWLVLLSIFWPLVRGMSWQRWRKEIGWQAPRGVLREIGIGVLAYLASLPLYFFLAIVVVVVTLVYQKMVGEEAPPPTDSNKVFDLAGAGSPVVLVAVFMLATFWAPIVEESIFRGALFRHVRSRAPFVVALLVSAGVFAALHSYVLQGVIMVGGLGMAFACMREWRGSLIPSATAHFLHNATVLTLLITLFSFVKP